MHELCSSFLDTMKFSTVFPKAIFNYYLLCKLLMSHKLNYFYISNILSFKNK